MVGQTVKPTAAFRISPNECCCASQFLFPIVDEQSSVEKPWPFDDDDDGGAFHPCFRLRAVAALLCLCPLCFFGFLFRFSKRSKVSPTTYSVLNSSACASMKNLLSNPQNFVPLSIYLSSFLSLSLSLYPSPLPLNPDFIPYS